eukprot:c21942_g1_i1 orf=474-1574(-)
MEATSSPGRDFPQHQLQHLHHLPPPPADAWLQAWRALAPQWERIRCSFKVFPWVPILRVNQFDAARLDVEMTAMLKEQLMKVFSLMQPGLLSRYESELDAFLEFLIWRFSIWVDKPTPGNALMNLRYRDERAFASLARAGKVKTGLEGVGLTRPQKLVYCLAMVGGRYGWARLQMISAFRRWGDSERSSWSHRAWVLLQRAENIYKVVCFFNLLLFLHTGRYQTVVERLLAARLVYEKPNMNRAVSFEYMNRQLVWHEFSELILLMLPLLNITSLKKALMYPFSNGQLGGPGFQEDSCPICEARPITITYVALPCEHLYCYFCLRTRCIANLSYRCARCNTQVVAMKRHYVQVNINPSEQVSGKRQ